MFTLEIGGKPVAITDADEAQARAIFESDEFKQDLTVMTTEGIPLWTVKLLSMFGPPHRRRLRPLRSQIWISTMMPRMKTTRACS
jgi:hypothetical protein